MTPLPGHHFPSFQGSKQATFEKNIVFKRHVEGLLIKEKRKIFSIFRTERAHPDAFLPACGITLGEFSVFHLLDSSRQRH